MPLDMDEKFVLLEIAERQKAQYEALASIRMEVVALREAVRSLDPTFDQIVEHKRGFAMGVDAITRSPKLAELDAVIQKVIELGLREST